MFLNSLAEAIHDSLHEDDPEMADVVVMSILVVRAMMERDNAIMDQMASVLADSIVKSELQEDEAIALLKLWKNNVKVEG